MLAHLGSRRWLTTREAFSRTDALRLMAALQGQSAPRLPIKRLPDLGQITEQHVLLFCDLIEYPEKESQRAEFARSVLSGLTTSEQIIQALAQRLPPLDHEEED
jgi:hypothetical protein